VTQLAGGVQREQPLQDVVSPFCTHDGRAGSEIIERRRNRFGVDARFCFADARFCFAELGHLPAQPSFLRSRLRRRPSGGPSIRVAARSLRKFRRTLSGNRRQMSAERSRRLDAAKAAGVDVGHTTAGGFALRVESGAPSCASRSSIRRSPSRSTSLAFW